MDFHLSESQLVLQETVRGLLERRSPEGRSSTSASTFDSALWRELQALDCFRPRGGRDLLEASIVVEEVSRWNVVLPIGLQMLLASEIPQLRASPLAICRAGANVPVRFAAQAAAVVVLGDDTAQVYEVDPAEAEPVASNYVYPLAYPAYAGRTSLLSLPAETVLRRWQLALTSEAVGAMDAALNRLVTYLSERQQFGRPLGAFQAIQHRLSELAVSVESTRLLLREAAWCDDSELAASAACYAATAARQVCLEAHQLSGARGFTLEFGLEQTTLRLQVLSLEAGGVTGHAAAVAVQRWSGGRQLLGCDTAGPGEHARAGVSQE